MKSFVLFLMCFTITNCICNASPSKKKLVNNEYDVLVYGGSSGGFTAAIQVAKMGKKVILLEPSEHVGGMNVEGLGGTDIDNHPEFKNSPAVGGLALEFYKRIADKYNKLEEFELMLSNGKKKPDLWRFEPHVAEEIINGWLKEYSIKVVLNAKLVDFKSSVKKADGRITAITTTRGVYKAEFFIDATIEGDLLASAGVATTVGRESNQVYNETKNGIRGETTHNQFQVEIDPFVNPGYPKSGVIKGVKQEPLGVPGNGDHRLQAYCFRVCLTNDPKNKIPFPKPDHYDRNNYKLFERYLLAGGQLYRPRVSLPNQKCDFNGGRDVSHNLNGMNYGYPTGNYHEREKILEYHEDFTKGLFYFLSNDSVVGKLDPELQKNWSEWGLPRDEFTDNGFWPRMFYVRDARRMVSDYVITEHHTKRVNPQPVEDPVAVAFWPPDVHNVRTIVREGLAYNEGFVFGGDDWQPFGISYRALVPKKTECTNLITSTCPSSSHIAYGAIRIEFTFMAMGQAAGTAVVMALNKGLKIQDIDYKELASELLKHNQIVSLE